MMNELLNEKSLRELMLAPVAARANEPATYFQCRLFVWASIRAA